LDIRLAFGIAGPRLWNNLLQDFRLTIQTITVDVVILAIGPQHSVNLFNCAS